jgi:CheY-like chemotaxis protein
MLSSALPIRMVESTDTMAVVLQPMQHPLMIPLKILLVEDNDSDAELTRVVLDTLDIPYMLQHLRRGSEVVPYLVRQGRWSNEPAPDLILLDLGLPGEDGFEVLSDIAAMHGAIHAIPIVVLTGYEQFSYLKKVYEGRIADYLTKPCNPDKLRRLMSGK